MFEDSCSTKLKTEERACEVLLFLKVCLEIVSNQTLLFLIELHSYTTGSVHSACLILFRPIVDLRNDKGKLNFHTKSHSSYL